MTETPAEPPFLGSYRIIEPIAGGAMGSVFRAEHALLGRPAAVKILRPELTRDDALVVRFMNEAKAAAMIRHPGIVEVYDYGTTDDGVTYLVMELLEGESLAKRLAGRGRVEAREAAWIVRGVASALKAAHRAGIVHRDLKPANIFLVPDPDGPTGERVKVLDFGIAKLIDPTRAHQTQTGALIGTPLYMAPEQARTARTIDHRADLYSLGCLLYELLVGRPPFVAVGAGEIIAMHLFTPPEPPSRKVPVTPELERIVMRLLAKEPGDRFLNANEVIEAIDGTGLAGRSGGFSAVPVVSESRTDGKAGKKPTTKVKAKTKEKEKEKRPVRSAWGQRAAVAGAMAIGLAAAAIGFVAVRGGRGREAAAEIVTPALAPAAAAVPAAAPAPEPVPASEPAPASEPEPEPEPESVPASGSEPAPASAPVSEPAPVPPPPREQRAAPKPRKSRPIKPAGPVTGDKRSPYESGESLDEDKI